MVVNNSTALTKYCFDKQAEVMYPKKDSK